MNGKPVKREETAPRTVTSDLPVQGKKLEVTVPHPFIMGFKDESGQVRPYVRKAGLLWKLEEIAKKKKGLIYNGVVCISASWEDPQELFKIYSQLDDHAKKLFMEQRNNDFRVFTTPKGTALYRGIIRFGNGETVVDDGIANRENVKMSTLHVHLDQMAATRARNRAIRAATAEGFMPPELACGDEDWEFAEEDVTGDYVELEAGPEPESRRDLRAGTQAGTEPRSQEHSGSPAGIERGTGHAGPHQERHGHVGADLPEKTMILDLIARLKTIYPAEIVDEAVEEVITPIFHGARSFAQVIEQAQPEHWRSLAARFDGLQAALRERCLQKIAERVIAEGEDSQAGSATPGA